VGHRMVLSVQYAGMRAQNSPVQRNGEIKQTNYSTVVQLRFR